MNQLPPALAPMGAYPNFILYKLVPRENKVDKLPVDFRTGQVFKQGDNWQQDPAARTDAQTALTIAATLGDSYGVGFFFTVNDPFFFVDIDKCLLPSGQWSPIAHDLIKRLPGAAVEISQSGAGLHIFGTGEVPEHACKNIAAGIELYTSGRFVALTGFGASGNAATDCTAYTVSMVNDYFPPKITARGDEWTSEPLEEYTPFKDDEALIKKACKVASAASKFGNKASFNDLWSKNVSVLAANYAPDASDKGEYDESSADAALAQHLAFYTGCNCDHMLNLMWCSGLVREKWSWRQTYLQVTIQRAVSLQSVVYTAGRGKPLDTAPAAPTTISGEPTQAEGYQFLAPTQQAEYFKGCTYIQDSHRVLIPGGAMLKPEQFNATYGGYIFQLDSEATGKTTKKAWEAFTESQVMRYPIAESTCFKPNVESGTLVSEEGRALVNTYVPILTPRQSGDITPFKLHLCKLLPNEQDRDILMAYMAAVVQHKGVKFQWAPLLQGAEGNGKTLFTRCIAYAVGKKYTHMPRASEISEKFNVWLSGKIFIGVEDIYVPEHKMEVIEILKPMITADEYEIRDMQVSGRMQTICCNFIFNSNHKNAIRKTENDRRFAIFYTAQQSSNDVISDGMDGSYFPNLYAWLRGGGYAIVADYLDKYEIPEELNPAGDCHRAPMTSSTTEAITASLGGIEQEVVEAIEEGRKGFAGGWISSTAFENLLHSLNAARRIPPNKRRELLQSLGYDWHPKLHNGRVNNYLPLDDGKPRLYAKRGHLNWQLPTPNAVVKAYQDAQAASITNVNTAKFSDER